MKIIKNTVVRLTSNNKPNPIIEKIELTAEELAEVCRIIKNEPVKRTHIYNSKRGYQTEHTTSKVLTRAVAKKRLTELFGGICTGCGEAWPKYKITYQVGVETQAATLVRRYCIPCFDKWKEKL